MKYFVLTVLLAVSGFFSGLLITSCTSAGHTGQLDLQEIFTNSPEEAKSWTWWHWMNGNISKKGITNDLEEIKKAGLGGAQIFNVTDRMPAGPITFLSQEWMDLTLFAIQEADRLGLQIGMHNCPGWSASGGPWVEPKNAKKLVVFSEYYTEGGKINVELPVPVHQDFYEDIKVLAFTTLKDDNKDGKSRFASWREKTGNVSNVSVLPPIAAAKSDNIVDTEKIIDVSKYMDVSGRLSWDAPQGNWTIVRLGYTNSVRLTKQAPDGGSGLECDKFDTIAVKMHFDAYPRKLIEMARPYVGKTFSVMVIDSYEGGVQTWTAAFMQEFAKRRGYDMTLWLPCLTGRIVGSPELTDRFLADYRLTISDLYRDNYYGYMRKLVNAYGMKLFVEPYGDHNIHPIDIAGQADLVASEFWVNQNRAPLWESTIKAIASTAHIYDKKIVDAEAFTSRPPNVLHITPADIKPHADWAYMQGLNKFTFHSYPHQPRPDVKPGISMGPHGTFFTCNNTWWEPGKALFDYFTRCNAMLQQGLFVADILSYTGDVAPWTAHLAESGYENLNFYNGYSFDYCNTDVILNRISIKNGKIALPGGMTYSLLLLPKGNSINLTVLQKIQTLVKQGMTLVGERPEISQGLKGYPDSDAQVKSIAAQLWGNDNAASGVYSYGKGKVFWGKTTEQVLQELSIVPDFVGQTEKSDININFTHRSSGDADIYFLSNSDDKTGKAECFFRVKGKLPELWNPSTGEMKTLSVFTKSQDGVTVPLYFDRNGSLFIVFRKSDKGFKPVEDTDLEQFGMMKTDNVIDISDNWDVWFDPAMGGVGDVMFGKLNSWIVHENPEIKYYSGTAIYKKNFDIPETMSGNRLYLTFDRIADLAKVVVNGAECAILWTPPYRVDITKYIKSGNNTIEIAVTNTWKNRLVGDERYPENHAFAASREARMVGTSGITKIPDWFIQDLPKPDNKRVAFVTWKHYTVESPLLDAGIIGGVKIMAQK